MGALHSGHISLMKDALAKHSEVAASIFVNPTQFSAGEDLDKYPRTLDKDLSMLAAAGVSCVFVPQTRDMYPQQDPLCHVEPAAFGSIYEGQARPDFFRGVATVVTKLFNIVQPTTAFFGQKDVAQCVLIQRMVRDLNMPVEIHICETLRDADGLAMSSRNTYLTPVERESANILYQALMAAKHTCETSNSSIPKERVVQAAEAVLKKNPLVTKIEYISVSSQSTMQELEHVDASTGAVLSSAIRLGSVRLIDNVLVGSARNMLSK